ncbi:MAG: SBBP repeat-containing protein [Taibaiella sp.]|nr:SBBP repeat-containing protein [Taibaiella sp.]
MKSSITVLCFLLYLIANADTQAKGNSQSTVHNHLYFIENKGQIKDQFLNPRNDIQYEVQAPDMNIFISNGELHYQFLHSQVPDVHLPYQDLPFLNAGIANVQSSSVITYRVDVALMGARKNRSVLAEEPLSYSERFYLPGFSIAGMQAHTYKKITYKDVYPDIDWVIKIVDDKLEYEFIVGLNGKVSDIQLQYNGQTSLIIGKDKSITASTPLGSIREQAPICYDTHGGKIRSAYKLSNNNIVTYDVNDYMGKLVIDPVLQWGSYYGDSGITSIAYSAICDSLANVYTCGLTWSANFIATTGTYQSTYQGNADAFLVKFDSLGNRLWGTYYGGTGSDWASAMTLDPSGNIYMGGSTNSTTDITTPGSQEPYYLAAGSLWSGYLVKFNNAGVRQWATYVGGSPGSGFDLEILGVATDKLGHVYISGTTDDTSNIATLSGFKSYKKEGVDTTDCYLIQYDSTGVRKWGTYYGGSKSEFSGAISIDLYNNVYLIGNTNSNSGIATSGCYQPTLASSDAFLVKFDSLGNRLWGTYYGGEGDEQPGGVICDKLGYIYLLGQTTSHTKMASSGCFQPISGGGTDAFLAKFEPVSGFRLWGTYYGGPGEEHVDFSRMAMDDTGNIFITGITTSDTGIASPCAWQKRYGGGSSDAFLAKYNSEGGKQLWSTYYGGKGEDKGIGCASDGKNVYLCGQTNSANGIATTGSFQSSGGSISPYGQAFLAKFDNSCPIPTSINPIVSNSSIHIYPNPNNGSFIIHGRMNVDGSAQIFVSNMLGSIVYTDEARITNGIINKEINITNLASGEYFIKIASYGTVYLLKFIKKI